MFVSIENIFPILFLNIVCNNIPIIFMRLKFKWNRLYFHGYKNSVVCTSAYCQIYFVPIAFFHFHSKFYHWMLYMLTISRITTSKLYRNENLRKVTVFDSSISVFSTCSVIHNIIMVWYNIYNSHTYVRVEPYSKYTGNGNERMHR